MHKTLPRAENFGNSKKGRKPALGILPNNRPATSDKGSSLSPITKNVEIIDKRTGEIHAYDPANDVRVGRYVRQSAARRLLPGSRVSWCLRRVVENERPAVLLDHATGKAHYGGLMSCGRLWECPVCASKISQRRREELSLAVEQHRAAGGGLLLVTFTHRHGRHDDLADMMERQKKAFDALKASRSYKELRAAHGVVGSIRANEITHGVNGWHPHIHEIWFLTDTNDQIATITAIKTRVFQLWRDQCKKKGLGVPDLMHGVDVRNGSHASTYASKWGIEDEMTKSLSKTGRAKGRTPFQLLDDYIDGDNQAGALFREYVEVFRGKRQLVWSKGLRKRFDLAPEKTDEEIAAEQESSGDVLGILELEQWAAILRFRRSSRFDARAELLAHAERGGWSAVLDFCASLGCGVFPPVAAPLFCQSVDNRLIPVSVPGSAS